MHLLPRWKVLLCGIALLLGVAALVRPYLRLRAARTHVAAPWSPERQSHVAGQDEPPPPPQPPLKYKAAPTYTAPPVRDPFPLLSTSTTLPPIPAYNVPKKDAWKDYGLEVAPPLLIGFTRNWPMLLQAVVSYLTAGWPPEQLYVVENTGAHQANARGQLSPQNPRYLNHTQLVRGLGIRVVQTPVLLSFAQLQNFFLALSYDHAWPYYFWSHMDVLALSHEAGVPGLTPPAGHPGYKSLYTLCLETLQQTLRGGNGSTSGDSEGGGSWRGSGRGEKGPAKVSSLSSSSPRWAMRFFAYDHLTLQNPRALEAIGGWDTFIPYYMTDCDTYSRFTMEGWSAEPANAGIITDTASVLDDLLALYRDPLVTPHFTDPNPPPAPSPEGKTNGDNGGISRRRPRRTRGGDDPKGDTASNSTRTTSATTTTTTTTQESKIPRPPPQPPAHGKREVLFPHEPMNMSLPTDYWWVLRREADNMFHHKHGGPRGRNTWQWAQGGGQGEPFHYDAAGFEEAVQLQTEAGRQLFAHKWGHRDCDLRRYRMRDQWRVEKDW